VRWALSALCNPHLTPALSAPKGQRGRCGRTANEQPARDRDGLLGVGSAKVAANGDRRMNFERVLQKVLWRLVTEGSISYRRIKLSFGLDDDGLEELRRELIVIKRVAADVDGEVLVWAPEGRVARPEPAPLLQPLPALRRAEKPTIPAAVTAPSPVAPVGGSPLPNPPPLAGYGIHTSH
jgi:hypothetical protein